MSDASAERTGETAGETGVAATRRRGPAEAPRDAPAPAHTAADSSDGSDGVRASWVDRACCAAFYTLFWGQPFAAVGAVLWALRRVHRAGVAASWPLVAALALAGAAYAWVTVAWTRGSLRTGMRWLRFCNCFLVRRATRALGCRIEFAAEPETEPEAETDGEAETDCGPDHEQEQEQEQKGREGRRFVLGVHPHGITAIERVLFWGARDERWDRAFPGTDTRDLIATPLMLAPGARLWCLWSGCVAAGRACAERVLRETRCSLLLYPGGEKEALLASPAHHAAYVLRHRGFCRLALAHGADLVPCYVFGANQQFRTSTALMRLRRWVQATFAVAVPLFWGHALLPWVPRRTRPLVAVVGAPIRVARVAHPTDEQVAALHRRYIEALKDVFDSNKARLGYPRDVLEIY